MPASEKKVAANRSNASRSTGPRTPEGRDRSRLNAVTHGLTAQTSVLPGEDRAQLEALSNSLMKQLKPRGVVQRIVAERIVSLAWKLRRVARAEEAVAREWERSAAGGWKYEREVNEEHGFQIFRDRPKPRPRDGAMLLACSWHDTKEFGGDQRLLRLTEYELKLDAALRAGVRELLKLQKDADAFEEVTEEAEAEIRSEAEAARDEGADDLREDAEDGSGEESETLDGETLPAGQNEPTDVGAQPPGGDPGLSPCVAAPAARGEAPLEKTNPIEVDGDLTVDAAGPGVRPDLPAGSSGPVP